MYNFWCFSLLACKVTTGDWELFTIGKWLRNFQTYSLEILNATFSLCFIIQRSVQTYYGVELYLLAFFKTEQVEGALLILTYSNYLPILKTTGTHWTRGMFWETEWTDWTKEWSITLLGVLDHVRPNRRVVTIHTELTRLQRIFRYKFWFPC
jgi:hypothetical protein